MRVNLLLRRGFTLIDLLWLAAIIVTLAGLLFPPLAKAKQRAKQTTCISNVKQIAIAMFMFVDDNDNRFPARMPAPPAGPAYPCKPCRTLDPSTNWLGYVMQYMGHASNAFVCPSDNGVPASFTADPSLGKPVWQYELTSYCLNTVMTRLGSPEAILKPSEAFLGAEIYSWHSPGVRRAAYFMDGHSELAADANIAKQCSPPAQPDDTYPGGFRP